MFDLTRHDELIDFLKDYSYAFKWNSSEDWVQIFCPYCDDRNRKSGHLSHGHCYISRYHAFAHCFRCGTNASLKKLLVDIGFPNIKKLNELLPKQSNYKFVANSNSISIPPSLKETHTPFYKEHKQHYHDFLIYLYNRLGSIDMEYFNIRPVIQNDCLGVEFRNVFNEQSVIRYINHPTKKRYHKPTNASFYFFQNPFAHFDLVNKTNIIVVSEGPFDIITLYQYNENFDADTFFIATNGSIASALYKITYSFLMFGRFIIYVVLDYDLHNSNHDIAKRYIKSIQNRITNLNPKIKVLGCVTTHAKDSNDFNLVSLLT